MKLSNQQAEVLAKKVHKSLMDKVPDVKLTENIRKSVEKALKGRDAAKKMLDKAHEELKSAQETLRIKCGTDYRYINNDDIYKNDLDYFLSKAKDKMNAKAGKSVPSIRDLVGEIQLATAFTDEKDVDKFVEKITKKFL